MTKNNLIIGYKNSLKESNQRIFLVNNEDSMTEYIKIELIDCHHQKAWWQHETH